jgi:hypothetical protein
MIRFSRGPASCNAVGQRVLWLVSIALAVAAVVPSSQMLAQKAASTQSRSFFVDCSQPVSGDGSIAHPWNTLASAQMQPFMAGDRIALARGTACKGSFAPRGSGAVGHPIHLTAYGNGARPKIVATTHDRQAFLLDGEEYWDIDSLDISGGNTYGVFVTGEHGILHHIYLSNLMVHDVVGGELKGKDAGLVLISPGAVDQHFEDVLVDGVTAYHTTQWAGILVGGGKFGYPPEYTWSSHVIIRNSMIHDVQGDGIVLFRVRDGRIASSVAWDTGMQITETTGTPNAIWTWMCHDCVVEGNEAFLTDSPGVDGGAFDIDYGNTNNSVLGNYGHDTQGYCVSAFGAGFVTHASVIRDNVCLNNARSPRMAQYQGAIFLLTWNNGALDGLTVENNTIYWDPPGLAPAVINQAKMVEGKAIFRNNVIYTHSPWIISSNRNLSLEGNQYFMAGPSKPQWQYGDETFDRFAEYQAKTRQDRDGHFEIVSPRLEAALWKPVSPPSQGAVEMLRSLVQQPLVSIDGAPLAEAGQTKEWQLYCRLSATLDEDGVLDDAARRQLMVLKSIDLQFHAKGLKVVVWLDRGSATVFSSRAFLNAIDDLEMKDVVFAQAPATLSKVADAQQTWLLSPDGEVASTWHGFAGPAELGIAVRQRLGYPAYSQMGAELQ